jgi:glutamyl-tRNA synthetase
MMRQLIEVLKGIDDFSAENAEKVVMDWIAKNEYNTGLVMNSFRLTVVGEAKGPHMFDITAIIGKDETIARVERALEALK